MTKKNDEKKWKKNSLGSILIYPSRVGMGGVGTVYWDLCPYTFLYEYIKRPKFYGPMALYKLFEKSIWMALNYIS